MHPSSFVPPLLLPIVHSRSHRFDGSDEGKLEVSVLGNEDGMSLGADEAVSDGASLGFVDGLSLGS